MTFNDKLKTGILLFLFFGVPIIYNLHLLKTYVVIVCIFSYFEFCTQVLNYSNNIFYHFFILYWLIFPIFIIYTLIPLEKCWEIILLTLYSDIIQQTSNKIFVYSNIQNMYVNKVLLYNPFHFLSPKKTIVGYLGGTSTLVFSYIYNYNSFYILSFYLCGCVGDLFASYFKRQKNLNDYSNFLGSHGGFLDRFDSILFNIHLLFLYSLFTEI